MELYDYLISKGFVKYRSGLLGKWYDCIFVTYYKGYNQIILECGDSEIYVSNCKTVEDFNSLIRIVTGVIV